MGEGKTRIGFVGVGGMGQCAHLRNYVTLPGCEVVAIAEIREKTGALVAARYGVRKVYPDHREMLAKERLDGVVASQPFDRHAVLLPEIYGKVPHVFTEKPLAIAVSAGEALADAAEKSGSVHMIGYNKRSDPATECAKGTIAGWRASGEMGRLRYIRITMPAGDWIAEGFTGLLDGGDPRPQLDREPPNPDFSGDAAKKYVEFVNYYIHQVNLMRHLMGEPYRVVFTDRSGVLFAVESDSGVTGTVEMTPYRTTIAWEETTLAAFEKGYVLLKLPAPLAVNRPGSVEVYADPGGGVTPLRTEPTLPWIHSMRRQAENFIRVCRGEVKPPCDAREAVEDLKIARDYIRMFLR